MRKGVFPPQVSVLDEDADFAVTGKRCLVRFQTEASRKLVGNIIVKCEVDAAELKAVQIFRTAHCNIGKISNICVARSVVKVIAEHITAELVRQFFLYGDRRLFRRFDDFARYIVLEIIKIDGIVGIEDERFAVRSCARVHDLRIKIARLLKVLVCLHLIKYENLIALCNLNVKHPLRPRR